MKLVLVCALVVLAMTTRNGYGSSYGSGSGYRSGYRIGYGSGLGSAYALKYNINPFRYYNIIYKGNLN